MTTIPLTSAPSQLNSTHDDGQRGSAAQRARWFQIKKNKIKLKKKLPVVFGACCIFKSLISKKKSLYTLVIVTI
jgi:hypothetical protein